MNEKCQYPLHYRERIPQMQTSLSRGWKPEMHEHLPLVQATDPDRTFPEYAVQTYSNYNKKLQYSAENR